MGGTEVVVRGSLLVIKGVVNAIALLRSVLKETNASEQLFIDP